MKFHIHGGEPEDVAHHDVPSLRLVASGTQSKLNHKANPKGPRTEITGS